MMIFMMILICISAFLFGFFLGSVELSAKNPEPKIKAEENAELERLKHEYENFLSYDGSEQA